jgi:hypothetical protein
MAGQWPTTVFHEKIFAGGSFAGAEAFRFVIPRLFNNTWRNESYSADK